MKATPIFLCLVPLLLGSSLATSVTQQQEKMILSRDVPVREFKRINESLVPEFGVFPNINPKGGSPGKNGSLADYGTCDGLGNAKIPCGPFSTPYCKFLNDFP